MGGWDRRRIGRGRDCYVDGGWIPSLGGGLQGGISSLPVFASYCSVSCLCMYTHHDSIAHRGYR